MDRAALIRGAAFALGLLVSTVASAQPSAVSWPNVVLKYATDGTPLLQPRVPLASTAAGGGAATLNAAQKLAIGNALANLQLTRNVPLANVAKLARIAAWGAGPLALMGLALTAYDFVDGVWLAPPQPDPTVEGAWAVQHTSYGLHLRRGSPEEACRAGFAYQGAKQYASTSYLSGGSGPMTPDAQWGCYSTLGYLEFAVKFLTGYTCPNGGTLLPDGQCQPAGDGVPATEQQLETGIAAALQAQPTLAGQVLDAALASSAARAELLADAMGITGPATVDGGTTTSTKVDTAGTTTIQTATTYNLSYQGDTVNLTQTKVETVTDPANNVTTTTTTTATPTGEPPPPEEQSKFCEEFPDASACQELGEHEPDGELGEEQRALSWSPELSAAGSCPAPITLSIMGSTQSLEWSSVCDLASGVRPVVIALAWLSAAVFVFGVGRVTAS